MGAHRDSTVWKYVWVWHWVYWIGFIFLTQQSVSFSLPFIYRSICWLTFFKIDVLKNFTNFTGKQLCWSLILVKLQTWFAVTLLKRDFNTGISIFKNTFFLQNTSSGCFLCLSDWPMLCELNCYVETPAQAFSCEFCEVFKNIIDQLRCSGCFFLLQDAKHQNTL